MAQIGKIQQKPIKIVKERTLTAIPKKSIVKSLTEDREKKKEENNKRGRAGNVWPFGPTQKTKVIENGKRI